MKQLLILLGILALHFGSAAQVCNMYTDGLSSQDIQAGNYFVGDTVKIGFRIHNLDGSLPPVPPCSYAIGDVEVIISFPVDLTLTPIYVQYQKVEVYSGSTGLFNWTYDAVENVLSGVNNVMIPGVLSTIPPTSDSITVFLTATTETPVGLTGQIGQNIQVTSGANNTGDDGTPYPFTVTSLSSLGMDLEGVDVREKDCKALITWQMANEEGVDHYEVQYTRDLGNGWTTAGKVKADHSSDASYNYAVELLEGSSYVRIAMVHVDGMIQFSQVQDVTMTCGKRPNIELKTNPVVDGIVTLLYTEEDDQVLLFDGLGRMLKSEIAKNNDETQVDVEGLSQGMYFIKVRRRGTEIFSSQVFLAN